MKMPFASEEKELPSVGVIKACMGMESQDVVVRCVFLEAFSNLRCVSGAQIRKCNVDNLRQFPYICIKMYIVTPH